MDQRVRCVSTSSAYGLDVVREIRESSTAIFVSQTVRLIMVPSRPSRIANAWRNNCGQTVELFIGISKNEKPDPRAPIGSRR